MFHLKFKFYGLITLAFIVGLIGWRRVGIINALNRQEAKINERKLQSIQNKKEIERDVETQDDTHLIDRLTRR